MYTVYSSHGEAKFDEQGKLVESTLESSFGPLPDRLDFDAMRKANPGREIETDMDILMAAYWRADGVHVPVVWDFDANEVQA